MIKVSFYRNHSPYYSRQGYCFSIENKSFTIYSSEIEKIERILESFLCSSDSKAEFSLDIENDFASLCGYKEIERIFLLNYLDDVKDEDVNIFGVIPIKMLSYRCLNTIMGNIVSSFKYIRIRHDEVHYKDENKKDEIEEEEPEDNSSDNSSDEMF